MQHWEKVFYTFLNQSSPSYNTYHQIYPDLVRFAAHTLSLSHPSLYIFICVRVYVCVFERLSLCPFICLDLCMCTYFIDVCLPISFEMKEKRKQQFSSKHYRNNSLREHQKELERLLEPGSYLFCIRQCTDFRILNASTASNYSANAATNTCSTSSYYYYYKIILTNSFHDLF